MPAEWEEQDAIQITWLDHSTDWIENLLEAEQCFIEIAKAILTDNLLIIVHSEFSSPQQFFTVEEKDKIFFHQTEINDTWSRDHGMISIRNNESSTCLDFNFNGWGNKFNFAKDNSINQSLIDAGAIKNSKSIGLVLEGGSIESNGNGIILTTSKCLLNPNRNPELSKKAIEKTFSKELGIKKTLWLNHGSLIGDDTDSHIDILARFIDQNSIIYNTTKADNQNSDSLLAMEKELKAFTNLEGKKFILIPIPLPTTIHKHPANYVNFLISNKSVLVPQYNCKEDKIALETIQNCFPNREIIGINCLPIIKQGGAIHCLTMQFPKGTINLSLFNHG